MTKHLLERILRFIGLKVGEIALVFFVGFLSWKVGTHFGACGKGFWDDSVEQGICAQNIWYYILPTIIGLLMLVLTLFLGIIILVLLWQFIKKNWEWAK